MPPLKHLPRPNLPLQSLARAFRRPTRRQTRFSRNPTTYARERPYTTTPPQPPTPKTKTATAATATETTPRNLDRILSRLPGPLQRYASRLRGAPVTHVIAFLVLHEITAVVPLLGLFGLFHYTESVQAPLAWMVEHYGGYVRDGVGRFERWFTRRGLFGFGGEQTERGDGKGLGGEGMKRGGEGKGKEGMEGVMERWEADPKYRVVVEVGLAYALTKVLLPVRIVGSVWATPWFAGVLGRLRRVVGRGG